MKVITANLNGIRSAYKKGFFEWAKAQSVDVICVQELKAQYADISSEMQRIGELNGYFYSAQKKGYSGVGLYTKYSPIYIKKGFGVEEFDNEGRYLEAQINDIVVISIYVPSGSMDESRQASKFRFMNCFFPHLKSLVEKHSKILICGDWNIAHEKEDLKNWKGNLKNSGFLPQEREWLTAIFELGFVDIFRKLNPISDLNNIDQYTWWSNRGRAWENNVGWRIDYQIANQNLAKFAQKTQIYKSQRFSDHAPLIIEYEM